jgi:hypothetical protein
MVKQAQKEWQSAHRTQWAAQFAVASELCKRGYQVALTMGFHPVINLMVISPKGAPFLVDVKAQHKNHSWPWLKNVIWPYGHVTFCPRVSAD